MRARVVYACCAALALAGCGNARFTDLEDYVAQVKARDPRPIEPIPDIKQVDIFVYDPRQRRSPFVLDEGGGATPPDIIDNSGLRPDDSRPKDELERFPLDSLRMVGTLAQGSDIWALIATKEGTLHRVAKGNYLGQNHGQITRISDEAIDMVEIVPGSNAGTWQERQASIGLSR